MNVTVTITILLIFVIKYINCNITPPSGSIPLPDGVNFSICQDIICLLEIKQLIVLNNEIYVAVFSRNLSEDAYLALYIGWLHYIFNKSPYQLHFVAFEFGDVKNQDELKYQTSIGLVMLSILPKKSIYLCFEQGSNVFGLDLLTLSRKQFGIGPTIIIHLNHEQPWIIERNHPDYIYSTIQEVKEAYMKNNYVFRNYYYQYFDDLTFYFPVGPSKFGFHIQNPNSIISKNVILKASERENYCIFIGRLGYEYKQSHSQSHEREYLVSNDISPCTAIIKQPNEKMEYFFYIELLSKSTFILCPAGNNPETFRLYEALEVGAIPLFVRPSMEISYLQYKYWDNYPGPIFNTWDDLKPFLNNMTENYVNELQNKVALWYKEFIENVQYNVSQTMLMAFHDDDNNKYCKSQTNNENTNTILIENESAYLETLEKKLDDINVQQQELMKKLKQHYMDKIKKIQ